ncbi:MAG: stage III sporulation protein AF [Clostridia bacterium]|nr:stage III sporulation protein AF [Clostridia bacterium]
MEWVSSWIQGIIMSVIISTIIEMILPEGNSKKYIKVVIGVYILFTIISPVITKITGDKLKLSDMVDLNEYIEVSSNSNYQNLEEDQERQIKNVYETSLKSDIQKKIEAKGYKVETILIELKKDESYTLKQLNLKLSKEKEQIIAQNNIQTVNEIKVQIEEQKEVEEKNQTLSILEQKQLKQYLSNIYEIEEKNININ